MSVSLLDANALIALIDPEHQHHDAAHGADLCGVVVQGAGYDLWASHRGSSPELRASIEREAGGDSTAWRARSPLFVADRIRVPVMVLHGDRDETAPVAGARAFIAARESKKLPVEANITERGVRSRVDPSKSALDFLGRCFAR